MGAFQILNILVETHVKMSDDKSTMIINISKEEKLTNTIHAVSGISIEASTEEGSFSIGAVCIGVTVMLITFMIL